MVAERQQPRRANKFNAQPVTMDGIRHDSKHEGSAISYLLELERRGLIRDLRRQKCELLFALDVNNVRVADYEADARFTCVKSCEISTLSGQVRLEPDKEYVIDAKSAPTRKKSEYVMKKKLLLALYGHRILEV